MTTLKLETIQREERGKQNTDLREHGMIPLVLYGHGIPTQSLKAPKQMVAAVVESAGQSTLIDLQIDGGKPVKALVQEVQMDPVKDSILHVDFHQVRMDEKIQTEIPIVFEGFAPAVKELGGTLVKNIEHVNVECLPEALIPQFSVNVECLATFEDQLKIGDLAVPEGMKVLNDAEDVIALVTPPHVEEPEPIVAEGTSAEETPADGTRPVAESNKGISKKEDKKEK